MMFLTASGCSTVKTQEAKFNAQWVFVEKDGDTLGCLKKEDVMLLRELLIRLNSQTHSE